MHRFFEAITRRVILDLPASLEMESLTAIIDTREQSPWDLSPMPTIRQGLHVGDYSLKGLESIVAIERKSLPDLVMCCGSERDRFQRELDALRGWPVSAVIIEAEWSDLQRGEWRSRLTPKQVMASVCAWVAQGHTILLAGTHESAAHVARGVLFYAARYRWRELRTLLHAGTKH